MLQFDLVLLLVAIVSASSGVTWFALMSGPPVLKACWRMQITVLMQAIPTILEVRSMSDDVYAKWKQNLLTVVAPTGFVLGIHFFTVSACVASTSLSHAILLVNAPPLFLVSFATTRWMLSKAAVRSGWVPGRRELDSVTTDGPATVPDGSRTLGRMERWFSPGLALPPTSIEAVGAVFAFLGVAGLVSAAGSGSADEARATVQGDLVGLVASAALAYYFAKGSGVRKWCPLFSWLCPLHVSAAITTAIIALVFVPGTVLYSPEPVGVFSWMAGGPNTWWALGASIFAGTVGHGLANYVIGRVGPLVVSVFQLLQPLTGTYIGFLAGVQGPPGLAALLCAPVILSGAFLVTAGNRERGLTWKDILTCRISLKAGQGAALKSKDSGVDLAGQGQLEGGSLGKGAGMGPREEPWEEINVSALDLPGTQPRTGASRSAYDSVDEWGPGLASPHVTPVVTPRPQATAMTDQGQGGPIAAIAKLTPHR